MKGIVRWTTGEEIEGETDNGKITQFHSDTAASPMQIVLQAHGCLLYTSPSPRDS